MVYGVLKLKNICWRMQIQFKLLYQCLTCISFLYLLCFPLMGYSQENPEDFPLDETNLEPVFISFSHLYYDVNKDSAIFDQEKVSFGVRFKLNDYWSGNVWVDFLKDPGEPPYLKPAHITYNNNKFKIDLGVFFVSQWRVQQQYWQNRYVHESFQSYYDLGYSADLGIRGTYFFNEKLKADVAIVNGKGYENPGLTLPLRYGAAAYFSPMEEALVKVYYDFYNEKIKQKTFSVFCTYGNNDKYSFSAEYNYKDNFEFLDISAHGLSSYSNFHITDNLGLFFRFDQIWYDGFVVEEIELLLDDNRLILSGLQYQLFDNLRVAAAYKRMDYISYHVSNVIQLSVEYRTP